VALTPPTINVEIDVLKLDGVRPDDVLVAEALRRAITPALEEHGHGARLEGTVAAIIDRLTGEVPR
jgi:hypothetical protein